MDYKYTECGLDNVVIHGMNIVADDAGEKVYAIRNVMGLHKLIAHCIVKHQRGISSKELRFLRTEMGLTQHQLAEIVKKDHQTVGRWERGETPIDQAAELIVRLLAVERLSLELNMPLEELAKRCMPSAEFQMINVDGSDPANYRPMADAA
jgi:DNA-binding transcriptional regulator YiaG